MKPADDCRAPQANVGNPISSVNLHPKTWAPKAEVAGVLLCHREEFRKFFHFNKKAGLSVEECPALMLATRYLAE